MNTKELIKYCLETFPKGEAADRIMDFHESHISLIEQQNDLKLKLLFFDGAFKMESDLFVSSRGSPNEFTDYDYTDLIFFTKRQIDFCVDNNYLLSKEYFEKLLNKLEARRKSL